MSSEALSNRGGLPPEAPEAPPPSAQSGEEFHGASGGPLPDWDSFDPRQFSERSPSDAAVLREARRAVLCPPQQSEACAARAHPCPPVKRTIMSFPCRASGVEYRKRMKGSPQPILAPGLPIDSACALAVPLNTGRAGPCRAVVQGVSVVMLSFCCK